LKKELHALDRLNPRVLRFFAGANVLFGGINYHQIIY